MADGGLRIVRYGRRASGITGCSSAMRGLGELVRRGEGSRRREDKRKPFDASETKRRPHRRPGSKTTEGGDRSGKGWCFPCALGHPCQCTTVARMERKRIRERDREDKVRWETDGGGRARRKLPRESILFDAAAARRRGVVMHGLAPTKA
ncbi:hypothetical protein BHE74_00000408 [Ensete ventricosum]|nr:hypothetical protein GW17_00002552 [Ensete ventricosum]RWW90517.1 hypothetical protein BHE74_00000408 [Ensete ventricosum]RZR80863.1 hypothetical protein BHM03_00006967 [Ensete ventricosum]